MINLLPTSATEDAKIYQLKHRVSTMTTVVLLVFILLLAGMGGRSWYLAHREQQLSAEVVELVAQVNQKADIEANLRQQANRLEKINTILATRSSQSTIANKLKGPDDIEIVGWKVLPTGTSVIATHPQAANLENYAQSLKAHFTMVTVNSLAINLEGLWQVEVEVKGERE